ncbi:MAG: nucleoside monophosphate kinase [Candidatus Poribacteria bacterium]|nr:nucleoside monophosphate kinase [Candidatus Poribacteria bacterium]
MKIDQKLLFPGKPLCVKDEPCYRSVVLVGPPGVGKGTQGKLLSHIPGIFHLSSGDMFRQLDEESELGQLFHHYATHGEFVPDDITLKTWQTYIRSKIDEEAYHPETDLLVLDGIPRNIAQADLLFPHIDILKVLFMVCEDREVMFQRIRGRALKEHRRDDADELVARYRWDLYKRDTEPLIDYYPQELVRIIDADNIPAHVLHQILSVIVPIQKRCFSPPNI